MGVFKLLTQDDVSTMKQCEYRILNGMRAGERCTNTVAYENYCSDCASKLSVFKGLQGKDLPKVNLPTGRSFRLAEHILITEDGVRPKKYKWEFVPDFSQSPAMYSCHDYVMTSNDGKSFYVHYAAVNPNIVFKRSIRKDTCKTVAVPFSAKTLTQFLDLSYGKTVMVSNWKEIFDVFECFDHISRNTIQYHSGIFSFDVPRADYGDYIIRLKKLYKSRPFALKSMLKYAEKLFGNSATNNNPVEESKPFYFTSSKEFVETMPCSGMPSCYFDLKDKLVFDITGGVTKCIGYISPQILTLKQIILNLQNLNQSETPKDNDERIAMLLTKDDISRLTPELKALCDKRDLTVLY